MVILVLLRVAQGIAVGGEWGGAALMALEHAESGKRGFTASFVNAGAPSGALLGSLMLGLFALLPEDQFLSWGWRIPFLLSAVLLRAGAVGAQPGVGEPGVPAGHGRGRGQEVGRRRCRCGRCCAGRRRCC